jgi:hypothetical protein
VDDVAGSGTERAATLLAAALTRTGSPAVLALLGSVPGTRYTEPTPGRLFRKAEPARLGVGDWTFTAADRGQLEVEHVVRGIALNRRLLPPAAAAESLADAIAQHAAVGGPDVVDAVEGVLYGLAQVGGPL